MALADLVEELESESESAAESAAVQGLEAASAGELEAASAQELESESEMAQAHRDTKCCQAKGYSQTQIEHLCSTRQCSTNSHSSCRSLLFRCEYVSG